MPTPHHDPAKLDLRHGLTFDKTKNSWRLRVTISRGRKLVGCRVPIWLHTTDASIAVLKRDAILDGFRAVKINIIQRPQKRTHNETSPSVGANEKANDN